MSNRTTFESGQFLLLEPLRTAHLKGVDRLRLISTNPGPSNAPTQRQVSDAMARLLMNGLACEEVPGPCLHILGGTRVSVDRDVRGYEEAFAILGEPDGRFLAMVSGAGGHQHDEEVTTETLAEAVHSILNVYRGRGALKPVDRGE